MKRGTEWKRWRRAVAVAFVSLGSVFGGLRGSGEVALADCIDKRPHGHAATDMPLAYHTIDHLECKQEGDPPEWRWKSVGDQVCQEYKHIPAHWSAQHGCIRPAEGFCCGPTVYFWTIHHEPKSPSGAGEACSEGGDMDCDALDTTTDVSFPAATMRACVGENCSGKVFPLPRESEIDDF